MSHRDTIPVRLAALPRENPMVWSGEENASGVFPGGGDEDLLSLLGTPPMELPRPPRLPGDFHAGPVLRAWFARLQQSLETAGSGAAPAAPMLLPAGEAHAAQVIGEVLGEGEVSGELTLDGIRWTVREAVLTGVWRVRGDDGTDQVEIAQVPGVVRQAARSLRPAPIRVPQDAPNVMNGPAVLAEISDRAANWREGDGNHVINFTLLPMSRGDQELLTGVLGRADLTLTSGGFGTCRIMASTVRHVWAVQYLNAMGHTILDTIEIGAVPDAARAEREDFQDSASRLAEILEAYLA